jgi:hypothetical protein
LLTGRQPLVGGVVMWLGAAVIGTAVAGLAGRHVLGYAVITSGLAAIATGIAWHAEQQALIVAMTIASGAAITGFGTVEMGGLSAVMSDVGRAVNFFIKPPPD